VVVINNVHFQRQELDLLRQANRLHTIDARAYGSAITPISPADTGKNGDHGTQCAALVASVILSSVNANTVVNSAWRGTV
jgi:hypothetical protein